MFDHVGIRVTDRDAGRRFYELAFEQLEFPGEAYHGADYDEWNDFALGEVGAEHPVTRRLHVGFAAPSREHVDRFWQALTAAGYADDGRPGPRPQYGPDYYGAFVLDPDGNSAEAVHNGPPPADGRVIDHLWIRVRDLDASRHFYEAVAPAVGFEVRPLPDRVQLRKPGHGSFSVLEDGPPTEHVHLAFAASDRATVDAFHRAALAAGFADNGAPGERPQYHPGYYGAFVIDPDGLNVEAVFHDR